MSELWTQLYLTSKLPTKFFLLPLEKFQKFAFLFSTTITELSCFWIWSSPFYIANFFSTTLDSESEVPFLRQLHHPISSASFNLKGWNLVCGTPWPNPALSQNFSPNGLVVLEIWQNMWLFSPLWKRGENGEERKMAAVAEMAASSPSNWYIWDGK